MKDDEEQPVLQTMRDAVRDVLPAETMAEAFGEVFPREVIVEAFREGLALFFSPFLGFWDVAGTVILGHPPRWGPASQYVVGAE